MFIPEKFRFTDKDIIERYVREIGFATLVSGGNEYPLITHTPIELESDESGKQILTGHLAKANPQWKSFESFPKVTAVFMSDINHYISSSWYDHPNVPTWNYISVHISGDIAIIEGDRKWNAMKRLTDRYEQGSEKPVSLQTLPPEVQRQLNGIVAFEIKVEKIEAAFKLSQNRDDNNFRLIINKLRELGDTRSVLMAEVMERFRK